MEPPALAENVAGAADALRQGNADAFPRAVPATQSVSPSVRQSVSPSVRQSVRNAKPHIAVLHSLPMVNIISSIIALTITPLIVMKVLLICFSSVLFILIMTRLAR
ncbi:hypothetical protein ARC272_09755 [Pantoea ananatis]|nr:hypothetical protein ARC272_09755 [Pantoea ananatis]